MDTAGSEKLLVAPEKLLEACVRMGASDIHLMVGSKPTLRVNGELRTLNTKVLTSEDTMAIMKAITPDRIQTEYQESQSGDFSLKFGNDARFRVAIFQQKGTCALALRLIPCKILSMADIGLPDVVREICTRPRGLFLVTGPTGSGKTTTLASIVDFINETVDRHIITLEDPIEYFHISKKSLVAQREIRVDVPDFPEGLRRALRQDPDVILVGEMRDLETMRAAVSAAETGHLVFATLHTLGAASTVNRIIDAFPALEQEHVRVQLAESLLAVLSQTLCPRLDGQGRIAAYEFMLATPSVRHGIRSNKPFQITSDIQMGKKYGMVLLDDHLFSLVSEGSISREVAIEKSYDPKAMRQRLGI